MPTSSLVTGESIHANCAAIPQSLDESPERLDGKFVEASGGTLFLDEVGELAPEAQAKLLRAIEEGAVEPVGARKPVKVDLRVVSSTNRNIVADVKACRFRGDLFDRLHVFPIVVPPLRKRPGDVAPLRHFLVPFAAEEGKRIRLIAPDALRLLAAFHRPGNVPQLENEVFRAVVLAGDSLAQARGFGVRAVCSLRDAGVAREQQTEPGPVAPERQKRKIA